MRLLVVLVLILTACGESKNTSREGAKIPVPPRDGNRADNDPVISNYLEMVSERRIRADIAWLSSFNTRYYKAPEGVQAVLELKERWERLTAARNDVKIELINHDWPQPSLKLTFQGADTGEIITGAHIDSINTNDEGVMSKAPGADDNASGVSVVTEVIRILVDKAYMPSHKIVFFAYAAEEVGLKGSFEIAESYQNKEANVLGVLNIDGTNYNGSAQKIVLIDDNTDGEQNKFIGELIDTYINVPWGYDSCDYACSDHYAWTYRGYKASFPAEALIAEENPFIHTKDDTLENMGNTASHSVLFGKLALAFILEMDKSSHY